MIKKFGSIRLKREGISNDSGCRGCFFEDKIKNCNRPSDHNGAFRCSEEYEGDFIEDENDDEGGYYETYEELYVWVRMLEMSDKTRVI